jgi:hypothetical protein
MPKFYRYLIYRIYTWRLNKKDDTPVATLVFLMSAVHTVQMIIVGLVITKLYPSVGSIFMQKKIFILVFYFAFSIVYYLLVYDKKKWESYVEEFSKETPQVRRDRGILVWLFTVGTIILFFILTPILFWPRN